MGLTEGVWLAAFGGWRVIEYKEEAGINRKEE